jgi:murein DD-endopeptidase MepM/ murein hydrolase activator NlpD
MPRSCHLLLWAALLLCPVSRALCGQEAGAAKAGGRADHAQAMALLRARKYDRALAAYAQILRSRPQDQIALYNSACAYALSGRKAQALEYLRKAIDAGFTKIRHISSDPDLKSLHKEPGFRAILKQFAAPLKEARHPGLANIRKILAEPMFRRFVPAYLPRYHAPELTPATAALLEHRDAPLRRAGAIALVHQNADSEKIRARVAGLLTDPHPDVREVAAEYLLWHGTPSEQAALKKAAGVEQDPFTRAAMRAALALIEERAGQPAPPAPAASGKQPPEPQGYADAWLLLRANPSTATRRTALCTYRLREKFEPLLRYGANQFKEGAVRERNARLLLAGELFGFRGDARMKDAFRPGKMPVAASFMAPVRDYFDPQRKSYGLHTEKKARAFGNSVHVGDDVSWVLDNRTVVAIGDGAVRRVNHVQSWGYLVIVEHRLPAGGFACSLYAHLGPAVCVKPGEVVRKGQKIGSLGRSHTWENGGYWSHLHFGIHDGPYLSSHPVGRTLSYTLSNGDEVQGRVIRRGDPFATVKVSYMGQSVDFEVKQEADWICGYISREYWKSGAHGWLDPQKFIRERSGNGKGEQPRPDAPAGAGPGEEDPDGARTGARPAA